MSDSSRPQSSTSASAVRDWRASLPAEPASLPQMRSLLGRFLNECGVGDHVFYNGLLVADELVANAIEHGSGDDEEVEIHVQLLGDRLCIAVYDCARQAGVPVALTPDEGRESGRGLQVVARLADWSEQIIGGRREVRAELPL